MEYVTLLHVGHLLLFFLTESLNSQHSMKNSFDYKNASPDKVIAERLNGWAAMVGFWAAVGAYLTTGQINPGLV